MPFYETVFMARQDLTEKQVKDLTDQFCKIITDQGGKIHKTEQWGLRTLAYKIKKGRKAHYVLIETNTPAPAVIEMERQMRLHDDVLRYLTVRENELSKGPSVMMDKSGGRDDERDSRPRFSRDIEEEAA
ncbi:MAG TPA: 30S ribosomal protein S6 [Rhodospirillaceae bacterium]|nr:30S ribosomal protein S6 [Rhodospirillaceae bacterium]